MNCLCCGKPIRTTDAASQWHAGCVRSFFGTSIIPDIEIDEHTVELLALEGTSKGITVPGVQKKLSLHLFSDRHSPRLTLVNYPTGYILKPQVKEFTALPESEHLVMSMADAAGISTVPHALIRMKDELAYITKRIDRTIGKDFVSMLAMEDFCQLDSRRTQDKYRGSYERCAKIINEYSCRVGVDMSELFIRLVFCYIVGNSDMHLKNFSLIETGEGSGEYCLSPAYDLLPVNLIMPEDKEEFALTMNGKKMHLTKKDFLVFAETAGIQRNTALKMINSILEKLPLFKEMCEKSLLPDALKEKMLSLMEARSSVLN